MYNHLQKQSIKSPVLSSSPSVCVANGKLELLTLLPPPPKCCDSSSPETGPGSRSAVRASEGLNHLMTLLTRPLPTALQTHLVWVVLGIKSCFLIEKMEKKGSPEVGFDQRPSSQSFCYGKASILLEEQMFSLQGWESEPSSSPYKVSMIPAIQPSKC